MTLEIRHPRAEELPAFIDALSTAFLERPDIAKVAEQVSTLWDLERVWAAWEDGRIVGTFRSWATELTVPGGQCLPGAAIAAVTVLATHRRRGILRQLVAAEHAAIRERGEAVGLLHASEYPIYGRFGYGPATRDATWTLDASATTFHAPSPGGVELVTPTEETATHAREVFEAVRARRPGEIRRRDYHWHFDLGLRELAWGGQWKGFVALRRDSDGTVDGFARYRAQEKWERSQPRYGLLVDDLHTLSEDAELALWRFLAEVDLVASVKAENRSPSDRLPWLLTNARAADLTDVVDGLWVRLIDVPRALEARTYERTGSLALEVVDDEAPGGSVRLLLDAGPEGARCRPTDRTPELTVPVAALGAAYLGRRLRDAALTTGVDEHRRGALADADALFRTADEPWSATHF